LGESWQGARSRGEHTTINYLNCLRKKEKKDNEIRKNSDLELGKRVVGKIPGEKESNEKLEGKTARKFRKLGGEKKKGAPQSFLPSSIGPQN